MQWLRAHVVRTDKPSHRGVHTELALGTGHRAADPTSDRHPATQKLKR